MKIAAAWFSCMITAVWAQQPAVDEYEITGVIIDHLTNRPLNHVLVEIVSTGKSGGDASVLTEANGRFTFLHVPKGKYQLLAEKRGQTPQGFHSDGSFSTAIVVDGKQKTDGIVFAMNTDGAINGTLIADDGDPVRNAQMMLFRESVNDGEAQTIQIRNAGTNSAGQFHFGHLEPGKYYIAAQATPWFSQPGTGAETVYPITFYGDTTDGPAARSITLAEGTSSDVQITLRGVPGIHVKLGDRARGVGLFVAGPGGTRIPTPTAFVGPSNQFVVKRGGGRLSQNTLTMAQGGGDGQTEMGNLSAGRYEAVVFGDRGGMAGPSQIVELANGSVLNLEPPAGSSITGAVLFDSPRPNGEFHLFLNAGHRGNMANVAPDGTFKFDNAAPGNSDILLGTPAFVVTSIIAKGARMMHDKLEVPSGASVEIAVHVSASGSLAKIEGFATQDNAGVPGAMVLLVPQDLGRVRLMRRDQSDSDGSFSLAGVPPGRYTLLAVDDGKDLAYKNETVIKPYLESGLAITIPLKTTDPIKVPVQARRR